MKDLIIKNLNQTHGPDTRFTPATEIVLKGLDLKKSGNKAYGSNVYISTHEPPSYIKREALLTGKLIEAGHVESFKNCELRCKGTKNIAEIALYTLNGHPISRILSYWMKGTQKLDEGLFTWLSPVEFYGTPWSDNDPAVCQVLTVDRLREFGREFKG